MSRVQISLNAGYSGYHVNQDEIGASRKSSSSLRKLIRNAFMTGHTTGDANKKAMAATIGCSISIFVGLQRPSLTQLGQSKSKNPNANKAIGMITAIPSTREAFC